MNYEERRKRISVPNHDGVLLKYIGKEPDVVIPENVTEIAKNSFFEKPHL